MSIDPIREAEEGILSMEPLSFGPALLIITESNLLGRKLDWESDGVDMEPRINSLTQADRARNHKGFRNPDQGINKIRSNPMKQIDRWKFRPKSVDPDH